MGKFKIVLLGLLFSLLTQAQTKRIVNVYFESNGTDLTKNSQYLLDSVIDMLPPPIDFYVFYLEGNTDNLGNKVFNDSLSLQRSKNVELYLLNKGLTDENISAEGLGFSNPIASNTTEEGRMLNRRVTVYISRWDEYLISKIKFKPQPEEFTIDAEKGGEFKTKSGSVFKFEPKSFIPDTATAVTITAPAKESKKKNKVADKKPGNNKTTTEIKGKVTIQVTEYRDPAELTLSTVPMSWESRSNRYFYASGGMFNVQASQKGKALGIKSDKTFKVQYNVIDTGFNYTLYRYHLADNHMDLLPAKQASEIKPGLFNTGLPEKPKKKKKKDAENDAKAIANDTINYSHLAGDCPDLNCNAVDRLLQYGQELAGERKNLYHYKFRSFTEVYQNTGFSGTTPVSNVKDKEMYPIAIKAKKALFGNKYTFTLKYNAKKNPELAAFKDLGWVYKYDKSNKPDAAYFKRKFFDILVTFDQAANTFQLELKDTTGFKRFTTKAKFVNEKPPLLEQKNVLTESYKKYTEKLMEREKEYIKEQYKWLDKEIEQYHCFWEGSKPFMKGKEADFKFREWLRYFDANKAPMKQRYDSLANNWENLQWKMCGCCGKPYRDSGMFDPGVETKIKTTTEKINKELTLNALGFYSYDDIANMRNSFRISALYDDAAGKRIKAKAVFMFVKGVNGVISCIPKSFHINPNATTTLLVLDDQGKTYIVKPENIKQKKLKKQKQFTFTADEVSFTSLENFRKLLGY